MYKYGDVVQHKVNKWIGAVSIVPLLPNDHIHVVVFKDEDGAIEINSQIDFRRQESVADFDTLQRIDGYEFEAALALGDNDRALELYRAAQALTAGLQKALDELTKQNAAFYKWVTQGGDYPFTGEPPHLADQHFDEWFEAWKRDAYE